jgi:signal transduction histidine kinase
MFDAPRLQQLASNLIGNAIKFTPAGGDPVAVFMTWDGGAWILRIADHGIGVPAGELDDLGTRFYRATNAVEEFSSGTGLGLAVSKAIVDEHGGWLAISSAEGHGTTVTATFPCSDDPERRL